MHEYFNAGVCEKTNRMSPNLQSDYLQHSFNNKLIFKTSVVTVRVARAAGAYSIY